MDALNSGQLYSVNVAPHTECEEGLWGEQHNIYISGRPLLVDTLY